jgi:hypothetical protein
MNPCRVRVSDDEEEVKKSMAVLTAQRLARGMNVPNEDPGCVSCPHLVALSDRIRELAQRINELEVIPFDAVR